MFTLLTLSAGLYLGSKFSTELKFAGKYVKAKLNKGD